MEQLRWPRNVQGWKVEGGGWRLDDHLSGVFIVCLLEEVVLAGLHFGGWTAWKWTLQSLAHEIGETPQDIGRSGGSSKKAWKTRFDLFWRNAILVQLLYKNIIKCRIINALLV